MPRRLRRAHLVALFAASSLAWTACSSTDTSNGSSPAPAPAPTGTAAGDDASTPDQPAADAAADGPVTPPPDVAAFTSALATAVCERLTTCCSSTDYAAYFAQFHDGPYKLDKAPAPASCAATLTATLGKLHGIWAKSVAKGRMTYDAARAKACVAAVSGAACGVPVTEALYDPACMGIRGNEVFTKITPLGAACDDIADGTFYGECDPKQGFCGSKKTCEPWRKTGEDCQVVPTRAFCSPELACDGGTATKPGKCTAAPIEKKLGEKCDDTTGPLEVCAKGTWCNFDTHQCEAKKADGQACQFDDECATEHVYTCFPFGSGTCGSAAFCSGAADAGAEGGAP